MDEYIVITPMIDEGEVIPAGEVIRGDRFTAERIREQCRLGLIALVVAETPAEAPAKSSVKTSAKSPTSEA